MNFEMNLSEKYFESLNSGIKDIEVRLLDEKRSKLKIGDIIIFTNSNNIIYTQVLNLAIFNSFEELLNNIPTKRIGLSAFKNEALKELYSIYSKDKLKKHKIIAIQIKKINTI